MRTVSAVGGYWKSTVKPPAPSGMMCAVGSPSVIMMICLVPARCASIRRASMSPCCMFVP